MLIVLLLPRTALTWSAVATTDSMKWSMSTAEARKLPRSPSAPRSRRGRRCSRRRRRCARAPRAPTRRRSASGRSRCRRPPARASGRAASCAFAVCDGELAVVLGGAVAELPGPVHLVAEAPHPDAERLRRGRSRSGASDSAVPAGMLAYSSRSSASSEPRVPRLTATSARCRPCPASAANSCRPTSLVSVECQARSSRRGPVLARADAVLPAEAGDEVAAGVADRARRRARVTSSMTSVRNPSASARRVAGLVDAVVDAAAEVLDEGAEEAAVDGADGEVRVDGESERRAWLSFGQGWRAVEGQQVYLRLPRREPALPVLLQGEEGDDQRDDRDERADDDQAPQRVRRRRCWPTASRCHRPRPTVIGNSLVLDSMASGRK